MGEKKIIFYHPLCVGLHKEDIGGAEVGCQKTKNIYEKAGIKVVSLPKPAMRGGKLKFYVGSLLVPFKLIFLLLRHRKAPFHLVGYYGEIAWYEWILISISLFFRHKTIYELRNGNMVATYKVGSARYRKILKRLFTKPDVVLCQGIEYVDFIRQQFGIERSYYPNYLMDEFITENNEDRPKPIRLIFFGRLVAAKRIDVIISALHELRQRGYEAVLELIGGCADDYRSELDEIIDKYGLADYITITGHKQFDYIAGRLRLSHYFVFPSQNKGEGHSNSLTEAMGCGVVPIVSKAGFNVSICGRNELVIDEVNPKKIADKIIGIEESGRWKEYSDFVYQRVIDNYTEKIVGRNLISYVDPLFKE